LAIQQVICALPLRLRHYDVLPRLQSKQPEATEVVSTNSESPTARDSMATVGQNSQRLNRNEGSRVPEVIYNTARNCVRRLEDNADLIETSAGR
jgi:hypothetical protein